MAERQARATVIDELDGAVVAHRTVPPESKLGANSSHQRFKKISVRRVDESFESTRNLRIRVRFFTAHLVCDRSARKRYTASRVCAQI